MFLESRLVVSQHKLCKYCGLVHTSECVSVCVCDALTGWVIIRPHRLHAMHRCGLLLQILHVAWSVCLCVGHTGELCKNG